MVSGLRRAATSADALFDEKRAVTVKTMDTAEFSFSVFENFEPLQLVDLNGDGRVDLAVVADSPEIDAELATLRKNSAGRRLILGIDRFMSEARALTNLIGNAIRYTPADKSIHVHWRKTADGLGELSVQDTGPGIAPEHIPQIGRAHV